MDIEKNATAGACVAIARADRKKAIKETGMKCLFIIAATLFIIVVATVCIYLFILAVPTIAEIGFVEFLFGTEWIPSSGLYGIGTMIVGTAYATAGALIVGVPIGFLTAVFMARYCPKPVYKVMKPITNILAGIPSIIYGMWGLFVLVPLMDRLWVGLGVDNEYGGIGLLTASLILALMILPYICAVMRDVLRMTPPMLRESAFGVGCTRWETARDILMRYGIRGLLGGIFIGLGRALGETMAVLFVAGNIMKAPTGLLDGCTTIAATLANNFAEAEGVQRSALFALGLILLVMAFAIQVLAQYYLRMTSAKRGEK